MPRRLILLVVGMVAVYSAGDFSHAADENPEDIPVIRSARTGAWSDAGTWEGGRAPAVGVKVLVRHFVSDQEQARPHHSPGRRRNSFVWQSISRAGEISKPRRLSRLVISRDRERGK